MPSTPSPDAARDADSAQGLAGVRAIALRRRRVASLLTACMVLVYFGFIGLVAYRPASLGALLTEGLSVGILLGALVIVAAWLLTYAYVTWTNRVYDPAIAALRREEGA